MYAIAGTINATTDIGTFLLHPHRMSANVHMCTQSNTQLRLKCKIYQFHSRGDGILLKDFSKRVLTFGSYETFVYSKY